MHSNKVFKSLHKAAQALGERSATVGGKKVSPKVGKKTATAAATKLGSASHKNS